MTALQFHTIRRLHKTPECSLGGRSELLLNGELFRAKY